MRVYVCVYVWRETHGKHCYKRANRQKWDDDEEEEDEDEKTHSERVPCIKSKSRKKPAEGPVP